MYSCKRCNYSTKYKNCLIQHLNNKKQCEVLNEDIERTVLLDQITKKEYNIITYNCEFCNKKFNSKPNMYRHKKTCSHRINIIDTLTDLKNQNDKLILELNNIKKETIILNSTINNNTRNITNNNTQNINITVPKLKDFGMENMDALPDTLISTLFMNLRFRELLANLHCDPNYPENQNVRIKSIKRNTMEIFRNNKWDIMTFTKGLTELLLQGHKIFKDYYKNDKERILEEDMNEDEIKEVLNQLDQIEKLNKEELRPLLVDLQMMLEEYKENGSAIIIV
jgi:hypothetical protein